MPGTVLGVGEPAGNKPDKIPAFMKLTFTTGPGNKDKRQRERERESKRTRPEFPGRPLRTACGFCEKPQWFSHKLPACLCRPELFSVICNPEGL